MFPVSSLAGISWKAYLENKRLVLSRTAWEALPAHTGPGERGLPRKSESGGRLARKQGGGRGTHVEQVPRDAGNVFL